MNDPAPHRRIVKAACPHDCPDTCALEIAVEDGKAVSVRGVPKSRVISTVLTRRHASFTR